MHDGRMIRPGHTEAWSEGPATYQKVALTGGTQYVDFVKCSSLRQELSAKSRPKSSPSRQPRVRFSQDRPKTAASGAGCGRLLKVAHEPTRTQNFESHLRLQKKKTAPWQQTLDPTHARTAPPPITFVTKEGTLKPYQQGHGYVMQKNKAKVTMKINMDDFFEPSADPATETVRTIHEELDGFIKRLEQQILDLTLYLEEEKLAHRETKRKHVEYMKDKLEECKRQGELEIQKLKELHAKELESLQSGLERKILDQDAKSDLTIEQMQNDIKFLQGAFDSYKTQVTIEMGDKWKAKEQQLKEEYQATLENDMKEAKNQMAMERTAEKAAMAREFNKQMQDQMREHKKELEAFKRRYSSAAGDLARLQNVDKELEEANQRYNLLKSNYDSVCKQLTTSMNELTDVKIKLVGFETNFQQKVQEVDDKYKGRMHELMVESTELRRLYIKKCGQLFDEQAKSDKKRVDKVSSTKAAMQQKMISREARPSLPPVLVGETVGAPPFNDTLPTGNLTLLRTLLDMNHAPNLESIRRRLLRRLCQSKSTQYKATDWPGTD